MSLSIARVIPLAFRPDESYLKCRRISFRNTSLNKNGRSVVCQGNSEFKDTRIHWESDDEGWLGISSPAHSTTSTQENSLVQPRGDVISILLAAPSTHYRCAP